MSNDLEKITQSDKDPIWDRHIGETDQHMSERVQIQEKPKAILELVDHFEYLIANLDDHEFAKNKLTEIEKIMQEKGITEHDILYIPRQNQEVATAVSKAYEFASFLTQHQNHFMKDLKNRIDVEA